MGTHLYTWTCRMAGLGTVIASTTTAGDDKLFKHSVHTYIDLIIYLIIEIKCICSMYRSTAIFALYMLGFRV